MTNSTTAPATKPETTSSTSVPPAVVSALQFYVYGRSAALNIPFSTAVGIVSVLWYESKLNPNAQPADGVDRGGVLNPSGAYGIASWNGPRQAALKAFAATENLDVNSVNTQLAFVLTEAATSYSAFWAKIQTGATYTDLVPTMVQTYEDPAAADMTPEINGSLANAALFATAVINQLQPVPAPAPTSDPNIAALATFFQSLEAPLQTFETALTTLVNALNANNSSGSSKLSTS
jgi:tail lysozyme